MISNLKATNIQEIANLIFFTEKGYEIPTELIYTVLWEIIPNDQITNNFISNPKGHFMFDITSDDKEIYTIIDEPGKIINCDVDIYGTMDAKTNALYHEVIKDDELILFYKSHTYNKSKGHFRNRNTGLVETQYEEVTEEFYNTVRLTINTLTETIVNDIQINFIFDDMTYNAENTLAVNTNKLDNIEYLTIESLKLTDLANDESNPNKYATFINALIDTNYSYEALFPCVRYMGSIKQDKVSEDFIAASTIIIVEVSDNRYIRPCFDLSNSYKLQFEFQKNSEMKFISSNSIAEIIWNDKFTSDDNSITTHGFNNELENEQLYGDTKYQPIYFSVGFQAELEGCYQNIMAMYIVDKTSDTKYLLGMFTFLTEVVGEDERYRALLGNLGIPDPIKYPNIFKCQDPMEQGVDWTLINKKSKELMLSYDNIFPYVGTYKALLGAVKFLGYQDLIFKEWYRIKDLSNRDKYVAIQTYDLQKGETLKSKLKKVGVSYGDFERYKKLNRLSMIYHLNEIDDESGEYLDIYTKRSDLDNKITTSPESGLYKATDPTTGEHYAEYTDSYSKKTQLFLLLPKTYKLYEYRTDEILAKLYSVKLWLERYILGVNCYISDICGEGIIIERQKTLAYVTEHHLKDLTTSGHITPKITDKTLFKNSSAYITCSLNEFDSLTLEDYEDYDINQFIREEYKPAGKDTIYISAPLETLVVANEFQFQLTNNQAESGSLAEFTDSSYINNPILIKDNEILFYDETLNITKISKDELPIIEIQLGNLRYCHGNWKSNIAYTINVTTDLNSGTTYYTMYNNETGDYMYKDIKQIFLIPYVAPENYSVYKLYWTYLDESNSSHTEFNGKPSELIYTSLNKWNIPMFIIRNYKIGNIDEVIPGDFVLEIIKGRMLFRNKMSDIDSGIANGCEITFGQEFENYREQPITIDYTYLSDRYPIYTFDKSKIGSGTESELEQCVNTNKTVKVCVNRLGNYTVSVNAYDNYNNIFVNNSDDTTTISSKPIDIDIIMNSKYTKNDSDFCTLNSSGTPLTTSEKTELFNDISTYASNPLYPLNYRIYDIDPVLDDDTLIEYDNLSYAIDTPADGDYLVLNNFTERALNIEKSGSDYKLKLVDENPNTETIKYATHVGLCIYDNLLKSILTDIYPLKVKSLNIIDASQYCYDVNNSYIIVNDDEITENDDDEITLDALVKQCKDTSMLDSSSYFINSINAYIYSANEYIIDNLNDISINYDNNQTIIYDTTLKFVESQVIKICYTTETEIHNNYTNNAIDNETAYRIIDVSVVNDTSCYYVLDGIFDKFRLDNKLYHNSAKHEFSNDTNIGSLTDSIPYKIKICPVHLRAAQYFLRINGFGEEYTQVYNAGNVIKTQIMYEPTPLLFNSYLDTTYSAFICDYDPKLLQNIWSNPLTLYTVNDNLYKYNNPVTITKGRNLILRPDKDLDILTEEFSGKSIPLRVHWNWKSYLIDDFSNWTAKRGDMNIDKKVVFKSANKILSIKPELLGTLSPNMECIDVFGNMLLNEGDGYVYVDNTGYTVNVAETETREIYYKDVYVVGFETKFEPTTVLSSAGETASYSLSAYGASEDESANNINYMYKIYYNDGTVKTNEGATLNLLTTSGKTSKTNKVKVKASASTESHKSVSNEVQVKVKLNNTHERDLVKPELIFTVDIYQYGTSVTTNIYDLIFDINPIPAEGIETLTNDVLTEYITNINYKVLRSNGEVEVMASSTLNDAMLEIADFKFIHNQYGNINYIPANDSGYRNVGILQLTVLFTVRGITETITTTGNGFVYQN